MGVTTTTASAATYVPIATQTLGSDAANYSFTSISGSYTDLVLVAQVRGTSSTNQSFIVNYNGDTGSNYSYTRMFGDGSSTVSDRVSNNTQIDAGYFPGSNSTSGVFGICNLNIMNYSNSSTYKTTLYRWNDAGAANAYTAAEVALWRSTAAITSITVAMASGNLLAGSTFTLYGIKGA
jgi:hypothetical protein